MLGKGADAVNNKNPFSDYITQGSRYFYAFKQSKTNTEEQDKLWDKCIQSYQFAINCTQGYPKNEAFAKRKLASVLWQHPDKQKNKYVRMQQLLAQALRLYKEALIAPGARGSRLSEGSSERALINLEICKVLQAQCQGLLEQHKFDPSIKIGSELISKAKALKSQASFINNLSYEFDAFSYLYTAYFSCGDLAEAEKQTKLQISLIDSLQKIPHPSPLKRDVGTPYRHLAKIKLVQISNQDLSPKALEEEIQKHVRPNLLVSWRAHLARKDVHVLLRDLIVWHVMFFCSKSPEEATQAANDLVDRHIRPLDSGFSEHCKKLIKTNYCTVIENKTLSLSFQYFSEAEPKKFRLPDYYTDKNNDWCLDEAQIPTHDWAVSADVMGSEQQFQRPDSRQPIDDDFVWHPTEPDNGDMQYESQTSILFGDGADSQSFIPSYDARARRWGEPWDSSTQTGVALQDQDENLDLNNWPTLSESNALAEKRNKATKHRTPASAYHAPEKPSTQGNITEHDSPSFPQMGAEEAWLAPSQSLKKYGW